MEKELNNVVDLNVWISIKAKTLLSDSRLEWMSKSFQDPYLLLKKYYPRLNSVSIQEIFEAVKITSLISHYGPEQGKALYLQERFMKELEEKQEVIDCN